MLFYADSAYYRLLDNMGCLFIEEVNIKLHGCAMLKKSRWATGCIIESDDQFDVYCAMMKGFTPTRITDEEYLELDANGIVFFSKPRSKELRESVLKLRARLNNR